VPQIPSDGSEPILDSRPLNSGGPLLPADPGIPAKGISNSIPLDSVVVAPGLPRIPTPGQVLGGYKILEQVGAGGFSIVMRARHVASGDIVALKLPRVAEFVAHLRREALIASRFQDAQVVGIREVCLDQEPPFLVMPYIPGANLSLPDAAPGPRGIEWAFRRFRSIVEVVARLHEGGIVHGDLKPGNIRFDPGGVCNILDLGVARQQVASRQLSTLRASVVSVTGESIAGTLDFMAPEVMSGAPPGKAADVYALGVILHHLLCGRPPAFGVSARALNPFLPPGTSDFLRQVLHQDAALRLSDARLLLPSVDGFIQAEERCLRRRNGHARRRVFVERMSTLGRGLRVLLGAAAAVVLVLFATGVISAFDLSAWTRDSAAESIFVVAVGLFSVFGPLVGLLLGMTTINAWILGVPEKTYKNRSGHPLWTFMMQ